MAREMYLAGVSPEDLKPTPKAEPPKTPREKWENFWYHYKWLFWGCVVLVGILAVVIGQMVTKNDPDYTVLLVTKQPYSTQQLDAMEQWLGRYGEDLDEDGAVEVQIVNCYMDRAGGSQTYFTNAQMLQAHLATGDILFFAFDPENYTQLMDNDAVKESGFFTPLSFQAAGVEAEAGYWSWKGDSRVTEDVVMKTFPEELYFGVRQAIGTAEKKTEPHQQCMALLQALAENRPTAQG